MVDPLAGTALPDQRVPGTGAHVEDPRLARRRTRHGAFCAALAFGIWGLGPLYWRHVRHVPGLELVAWRMLFALPCLALVVRLMGLGPEVRSLVTNVRKRRWLALSALLVSLNWLLFLWAIEYDRLVEASLGYFINPLVNVAMGTLLLGEALRRRQKWAVGLATLGVTWLTVATGVLPWIAIVLALTFALYGLIRKQQDVPALSGLAVEVLCILPVALVLLVLAARQGPLAVEHVPMGDVLLLSICGPLTILPLLFFGAAVTRLRYVTIGFFQYLAPTIQLLLAVLAFHEPFTLDHAIAFGLIWLAIALYLSTSSSYV